MVAVNEDIERFDEEGYVLVRDVFNRTTILEWRQKFLDDLRAKQSRLLVDTVISYPELRSALAVAKLNAALNKLLGKPFVVLPLSSIDHGRFGGFHTDTTGSEMAGWSFHKQPDFRIVVLGIYLQENGDHGGGLRIVPKSHRHPDPFVELISKKHEYRKSIDRSPVKRTLRRLSRDRLFNWREPLLDNFPNQIDIPTRIGDALIWDMRLVHRASPQRVEGDAQPGGKVAVFYQLGKNNEPTMQQIQYYKEIGEIQNKRSAATIVPQSTENLIFM